MRLSVADADREPAAAGRNYESYCRTRWLNEDARTFPVMLAMGFHRGPRRVIRETWSSNKFVEGSLETWLKREIQVRLKFALVFWGNSRGCRGWSGFSFRRISWN